MGQKKSVNFIIYNTVKPRFTNALDHEQFGLRTRKPSKRRQKQITLDNFLLRKRPSGSEAESSGAKRQKKEKEYPSKQ